MKKSIDLRKCEDHRGESVFGIHAHIWINGVDSGMISSKTQGRSGAQSEFSHGRFTNEEAEDMIMKINDLQWLPEDTSDPTCCKGN